MCLNSILVFKILNSSNKYSNISLLIVLLVWNTITLFLVDITAHLILLFFKLFSIKSRLSRTPNSLAILLLLPVMKIKPSLS